MIAWLVLLQASLTIAIGGPATSPEDQYRVASQTE